MIVPLKPSNLNSNFPVTDYPQYEQNTNIIM
jgi:hypothetical protein